MCEFFFMKRFEGNIEYNVATVRQFSLDFSLIAVGNEKLELGMRNCVWK